MSEWLRTELDWGVYGDSGDDHEWEHDLGDLLEGLFHLAFPWLLLGGVAWLFFR